MVVGAVPTIQSVIIIIMPPMASVFSLIPMMMVMAVSVLPLFLFTSSSFFEQRSTASRVIHHGIVSGLLLLLDSKHGVISNFCRRVLESIRILQSHERVLVRVFCEFPMLFFGLQQAVDPALTKQIAFQLFARAILTTAGT